MFLSVAAEELSKTAVIWVMWAAALHNHTVFITTI